MRNNCLYAEWKPDSLLGRFIANWTKKGYTHSGQFLRMGSQWYYCDLDGSRKKREHYKSIKVNLDEYLRSHIPCHTFIIPKIFTAVEMGKMLKFWDSKESYGYLKLISFLFVAKLTPFFIWFYNKTGKTFKPILGNVVKNEVVCSVAVNKNIKNNGDYDLIKKLDEDVEYPGLIAKSGRFERYKA